jgi:choline transport protein
MQGLDITEIETSKEATKIHVVDGENAADGQTLNRRFSLWSLGAVSFSITCTWIGTGASLGAGLNQSSAAALWSLPVAGAMTVVLSAGMAELSSAYPLVGAQYIWSYMVAAEEYKPLASFL